MQVNTRPPYTRPHCPVARTVDLIGDKLTLLILRNLLLDDPHRFQDFANALVGINPATLSKRLRALQVGDLIARSFIDTHPPGTRYALTEQGQRLGPAMRALREFGRSLP